MHTKLWYFLLVVLLNFNEFPAVISVARRVMDYTGYQVYHIHTSELENFTQLEKLYDHFNVDVWQRPTSFDDKYEVMVARNDTTSFRNALENMKAVYKVQIEDVQPLILKSRVREKKRHPRNERKFSFNQYHNYREIFKWMKTFSKKNKDLISFIRVGTTFKGRAIWGIKIRAKANRKNKPVFWQDSLIHAREWIAGATLLWVTNKLVSDYRNNNTVVRNLLNRLDFVIVPVWNVDGYLYTWQTDRFWRKSRRRNSLGLCKGVDLNRNFDTPKLKGANSCSPVYRGTSPFSEPETESVARFLRTLNLAAYITVHSYFQLWMYPYGYTGSISPDHDELDDVIARATRALKAVHNTTYNRGSVHDSAYLVAGGSVDWVYDKLCVKHSYAVELRDQGEYGFLLPPKYIIPTAEEYYEGLKVVAAYVAATNSLASGTCSCRNKSSSDHDC